ncbi:MAG: tRNA preQ1(34) S-adenosylmethionine ribosyltransferase-isomerase QueA [Pseudomonadota bacterium]
MRVSDFNFDLPPELIARVPLQERRASRLLCANTQHGALTDRVFAELPLLLRGGDLLVLNDTRVLAARLFGAKDSGGRVEVLVERILDTQHVLAQMRASKPARPGRKLRLEDQLDVTVVERRDGFFVLRFAMPVLQALEQFGRVPLPPYMQRDAQNTDRERYQTVFANTPGAVAAPTAGLHFDQALLQAVRAMGVETATVTLHVGAGTFAPVRTQQVEDHVMHTEWLNVDQATCDAVARTRARGGRVIAVGTTSVRSLETAAQHGRLAPYQGETRIFIYPGYQFRCIDALITNFHLPESTLLMLVCAFGGYAQVMHAYRHAIAQHYRFYSYGDAMFLSK